MTRNQYNQEGPAGPRLVVLLLRHRATNQQRGSNNCAKRFRPAPLPRAVFLLAQSLPPINAPGQPGQTGTLAGKPILARFSAVPLDRDRPDFDRDTPGHFIFRTWRNDASPDRAAALLMPRRVPLRPAAVQQSSPAIARAPAFDPDRRAGRRSPRSAGECPASGCNAGSP